MTFTLKYDWLDPVPNLKIWLAVLFQDQKLSS